MTILNSDSVDLQMNRLNEELIDYLKEQISDLKKENHQLKESLYKLNQEMFDKEYERQINEARKRFVERKFAEENQFKVHDTFSFTPTYSDYNSQRMPYQGINIQHPYRTTIWDT